MNFTDLFIKKPVLATVVSLLILLVGVQAGLKLPIRQYPELSNTTITILTTYPGANADLIQGFITVPIQQASPRSVRRHHRSRDRRRYAIDRRYRPRRVVRELELAAEEGREQVRPKVRQRDGKSVAEVLAVHRLSKCAFGHELRVHPTVASGGVCLARPSGM